MKIAIIGDDTLAAAAAECCAKHFAVTRHVTHDTDLLWICHDTPIGDDDKPDAEFVIQRIREQVAPLDREVPVLISSQIPVGTTAWLEGEFPDHFFACSPENIRVATAVADFERQARIVVGRRDGRFDAMFTALFRPFTENLIFTDTETAEMVKHALNCYLATCIVFINEIARLCKVVGADADTVSTALRTEARVSPKAPLRPGSPYGGRHLERDIFNLNAIAREAGVSVPMLAHLKPSNEVGAKKEP